MRTALVAAGMALALCAAAWGQAPAPSPMLTHFRAYVAAAERGDVYEAEREATAALTAAEEARSPRIGVLATNLARTRALQQHEFGTAAAPAQRALEAGGDGVHPLEAQVLVALTQLAAQRMSGKVALASGRLGDLVDASALNREIDGAYLYQVADAWGYWALLNDRADLAVDAYKRAVALAEKRGAPGAIDRTIALTGLGTAYLYLDENEQAADALRQAMQLSASLTTAESARPAAEQAYLNAMAWMTTLRSKLRSAGRAMPDWPAIERAPLGALPVCDHTTVAEPAIQFPRAAQKSFAVGTIILRYDVAEDGRIHNVQIAASAPSTREFGPAVLSAVSQWRWVWKDTGAHCRRTVVGATQSITFAFD